MDVLVLIDKLDELVHNAKAVPLTSTSTARAKPPLAAVWRFGALGVVNGVALNCSGLGQGLDLRGRLLPRLRSRCRRHR